MGASIATNSVNSMVTNAVNVLNTYAQICSISGTGSQNQINVNGCTLNNDNIDVISNTYVSNTCITNANTQVNIASDISQTMQQAAQAITQQFSFPSLALANNFINDSITLADEISNQYNSTCAVNYVNPNNTLVCTDSTITNSIIKIESFQDLNQKCVADYISTSTVYNKLIDNLSQTSVAKQEDTFAAILLVIVLFLAVIAWFVIGVADNDIVKWVVVVVILVAVISIVIYTASSKQNGRYPFTKA